MSNKNSLEIAYQNARDLIHKKEYHQAIDQLNEILKIFPNELNSIYLLIDCFIKTNKPNEALENTYKALSFKKDDKKLLFGPTPIGNKIIEIEKKVKDKI